MVTRLLCGSPDCCRSLPAVGLLPSPACGREAGGKGRRRQTAGLDSVDTPALTPTLSHKREREHTIGSFTRSLKSSGRQHRAFTIMPLRVVEALGFLEEPRQRQVRAHAQAALLVGLCIFQRALEAGLGLAPQLLAQA